MNLAHRDLLDAIATILGALDDGLDLENLPNPWDHAQTLLWMARGLMQGAEELEAVCIELLAQR